MPRFSMTICLMISALIGCSSVSQRLPDWIPRTPDVVINTLPTATSVENTSFEQTSEPTPAEPQDPELDLKNLPEPKPPLKPGEEPRPELEKKPEPVLPKIDLPPPAPETELPSPAELTQF